MDWTDDAVVLSVRHYGENARIVSLLAEDHGRHAGLIRGSGGAKGGALQPGQLVRATWRARLAEHLGHFQFEPLLHPAALMLEDGAKLAALSGACALVEAVLPEREPHPGLYRATRVLLEQLPNLDEPAHWGALYVRWELGLLAEMGYGLDLESCAATGSVSDLTHVSPRSGRAVSADAATPYLARLLRLPGFLVAGRGAPPANDPGEDVLAGLELTGHFLENRLFAALHGPLPAARHRLLESLHKALNNKAGAAFEAPESNAISPPA